MKFINTNQSNYNTKQINNLAKKFNVPSHIIKHLFSLNISTETDINNFLNPGLSQFYNPFLFVGMQEAVNKINSAINNNKRITIVGDYDTDGICATAILYKYFESKNVKVNYFLPNRFLDGYGLTIETVQKIVDLFNPELLITVDCGISCFAEIEYAKSLGIDVIVTDHHEVPEQKPDCICIDPKDPVQTYPFTDLCGAGVALKMVHALGGLKEFLKYTNIASIATVADIVPLINENRAIVKHGLMYQQELPIGVKKLLSSQKISELTSTDIAFKIAPKLNTAGRMGDATLAYKLFIEKNPNLINQILTELENQNNARVEAGNDIYNDALLMLKNTNISKIGAIVLFNETWHAGVLGIVCAKLTEKYNRPVCLLTKVDNEYKGSIRSINGIDIYAELNKCKHLLVKFGGHFGAAGLTIDNKNIEKFKNQLNTNILESYPADIFNPVKYYNIDCNKEEITVDFIKSLNILEPFGHCNEKPVFKLTFNNFKPERIKNHPNFLKIKTNNMELLTFNLSNQFLALNSNCNKHVLLDVSVDSFKGQEKIKAIIKNIYFDCLNTNIKQEENNAYYLTQLITKSNHKPKIKTLNSINQAINIVNQNMGNLFICNNFATYKTLCDKLGNIIQNYNIFNINSSSGENTLLYLPNNNENFNNYSNIFIFDEILIEDYLTNFSGNVYVCPLQQSKQLISSILTDRAVFATYHTAIVYADKQNLTAYTQIEYFNQLKRLNPQFKNLKYDQFVFVTYVLSELKIININNDELNYSISINKNISNPLTNSKIYNLFNLANKIN